MIKDECGQPVMYNMYVRKLDVSTRKEKTWHGLLDGPALLEKHVGRKFS